MQQRIDDTVMETEAALEWLVGRGFVQRVEVSFGPALFRIVEGNAADVERMLAEERL